MTSPGFDITELLPSRWKAWVGAVSSLLAFVVPYVLTVTDSLPQPWPALVGVVIAGLTWVGIYKAPYKGSGAVLVHESQVATPAPQVVPGLDASKIETGRFAPESTPSLYENPWR